MTTQKPTVINARLEILDSSPHHDSWGIGQHLSAAFEAICTWIERRILRGACK
jgi:hypothetical protein